MDSARDASSRVASSDASSLKGLSVESGTTVRDASSRNRVSSDASSLEGPSVGNMLRDASSRNIG